MMKDDPKLQMNDDLPEDSAYSLKRRRSGASNNKLPRVLLGLLLVVVVVGGIFYLLSGGSKEGGASLQTKMVAFEQKIVSLERKIADLEGKLSTAGPDPALLQRLEVLAQKVETLEKHAYAKPVTDSKEKPAAPKTAGTPPKRYHTVQKGETLYRIGKKYDIPVEELRKLNSLSPNQPIRTGQKLLISPGQ